MKTLLVCLLLLASGVTSAETPSVRGPGGKSCGYYIANQSDIQMRAMFDGWAFGYMTAMNTVADSLNKPQARYPETEALELYMSNYCTQHPLVLYAQGVTQLTFELLEQGSH